MHTVLIGNTGSGKSSLARLLHDDLGLPLISSGRIARDMAHADPSTDLALKSGALAPEAAMRAAIKSEVEAAEVQRNGWILDGFPRMIEQVVLLMQWTSGMPLFIYLEVEPWICLERLVARERVDDNADAIGRKFTSFQEHTQPLIDLLDGGGVLHTIDGERPLVEIASQVKILLQ